MPRSGHEARCRLRDAALELYAEQGFDRTTTAEIARRAGVTERTFFRHFPDKREVLFDGESLLRELLVDAVDEASATLTPLEVLRAACLSLEQTLDAGRHFAQPRHAVITASPALHERELAKLDALATALAGALERRGTATQPALIAAHAAMTALNLATATWYRDPSRAVTALINQAFDELEQITRPDGRRSI